MNHSKGILALALIFLILNLTAAVSAVPAEGTDNFKMVSTIEYSGKGQFRSQAETLFTVEREELNDDMVNYTITPQGIDTAADETQGSWPGVLSFLVDRNTGGVLTDNDALELLENVNNQCVQSITKQSRENIGKTWNQSFSIRAGYYPFPEELTFDMKAIEQTTHTQGNIIAVRALSKPFTLNATNDKGEAGTIKCKIGTVYLFDSQMKTIYLSVSVFEATTKMNGHNELLRHEVATYKVNSQGTSVDLSGLNKEFAKLIRKVGLHTKELKVTNEVPLPRWARSEAVKAAQSANICAATACEGAFNPVITVCAASNNMIELQSWGKVESEDDKGAIVVSKELSRTVPGISDMKIAMAPAFLGIGLGKAGAIAGGTIGIVAIAGEDHGDQTPH
jgi:hypothetical protein